MSNSLNRITTPEELEFLKTGSIPESTKKKNSDKNLTKNSFREDIKKDVADKRCKPKERILTREEIEVLLGKKENNSKKEEEPGR